jgi:hypothetical protein
MAITYTTTPDSEDRWGKRSILVVQATLDNPYPAGGYHVYPQQFGFKTAVAVIPIGINTAGLGYIAQYNTSTGNLVILRTAAAASTPLEEPVGVDLSTVKVYLLLTGL